MFVSRYASRRISPFSKAGQNVSILMNRSNRELHNPAPKVIFSGIQPTGVPHLGNYLGALQPWKACQDNAGSNDRLIFSLVDSHAITVRQDPIQLRQWKRESLAMLLAIGLTPEKCIIFYQSDVSAHMELMWILSCLTSTGKLARMTQWKDKTGSHRETGIFTSDEKLKLGLLSYPVLQAADILMYRTTHVPVGEDQAQHLELARDLASIFNHHAGEDVLILPDTWISPTKRVMNLLDPNVKMSKSHPSPNTRIMLTDQPDEIRAKINSARTDSLSGIDYLPTERPGVANLIDILYACRDRNHAGKSEQDIGHEKENIAREFGNSSLKALKAETAAAIIALLEPIRDAYARHVSSGTLDKIAQEGAEKARASAEPTLKDVKRTLGLI